MSIHQFFDNLQDVSQESPLLEALRRVRAASLEQVTEGEGDNEWPIWNQPEPPPPPPAGARAETCA